MTIRPSALRWLAVQHQIHSGARFTSKFYLSNKSWANQNAWGLQIPSKHFTAQSISDVHLVCQDATNSNNFHYLCVPVSFIQNNLSGLDIRKNGAISLSLSALPTSLFRDERGSAKLNFSPFIIP